MVTPAPGLHGGGGDWVRIEPRTGNQQSLGENRTWDWTGLQHGTGLDFNIGTGLDLNWDWTGLQHGTGVNFNGTGLDFNFNYHPSLYITKHARGGIL